MARKKLKSTLKSSSTKLPKSRITKDPEEKPRKIREKAPKQDLKKPKKVATPRDTYSEEQLKQIRKQAAKKAAETRRKREAELPAQEREKLRQKRAEQARKNFSKKRTKENAKQRKQFSEHEPYSDYEYASWTDEALSKIEEFIESFSFEEKYLGKNPSNVWESTYQRKAEFVAKIRAILDYRISQEGRDVVAKQIYDSGIDVDIAINGIKRASTPEDVTYYAGEIIAAILDRPMTREEGEIYNDIAEANSTYDMGDDEGEY